MPRSSSEKRRTTEFLESGQTGDHGKFGSSLESGNCGSSIPESTVFG